MTVYTYTFEWRGRTVRVIREPNWLEMGFDHIEIYCVTPPSGCLPITQTGYRSHFCPTGQIVDIPTEVTAWLDEQAESSAWRAYEEQARQGDLFPGPRQPVSGCHFLTMNLWIVVIT